MYGNAIESMNDVFSIQRILLFFKRSNLSGIYQINHNLLILDGYGSHVISLEQTLYITSNTTILNEDNGLNLNDEIKYIQECAIHAVLIELLQLMLMLMIETSLNQGAMRKSLYNSYYCKKCKYDGR